jgi:23S rRNA pseudouridine2605 synthase
MKVRIAKYLAACGLGSRRDCEALVTNGRVKVNGEIIDSPALNVVTGQDVVLLDDSKIEPNEKVYYLLNKPTGYTSTLSDEHAERVISELVPDRVPVWPVGRLDRETSGLIILTNDGDLTQRLTHPKYEKPKTYLATLDKSITPEELNELTGGIELEDGRIRPDRIATNGDKKYKITIHEGRNRLVRRIFEHFGRRVIALSRIGLSFLELEDLKVGKYRILTTTEVEKLKNS